NQSYSSVAAWMARRFGALTVLTRAGLSLSSGMRRVLGTRLFLGLLSGVRKLSGSRLPRIGSSVPRAAVVESEVLTWVPSKQLVASARSDVDERRVVYFPSCAARTMGPGDDDSDLRSLPDVTFSLLQKAGFEVLIPDSITSLCCGMPFESKGHFDAADGKTEELNRALLQASENGRYPVLMDTSPCEFRSASRLDSRLQVFDPIAFAEKFLVPNLQITPVAEPIMLHITCSTRKRGLAETLERLGRSLCSNLIVPEDIHCCGFAGDKGFTVPELNQSALAPLQQQVPAGCVQGVSTSRTCEIGLSEHAGIPYQSIFYLMDRVSQSLDASKEAKSHGV
ncbi:MAG: (Fe-S)-binding protein, partial [Pseudomonadota bacterium]|nr:(Fe-S)-binding protein [Pseudomonadota bacterium]